MWGTEERAHRRGRSGLRGGKTIRQGEGLGKFPAQRKTEAIKTGG